MRTLEAYEVEGPCGFVANVRGCGKATDDDPDGLADWNALDESQRNLALEMAVTSLRALTAGLTAQCPVTLRPCSTPSSPLPGWSTVGGRLQPHIVSPGTWVNVCCGGQDGICAPDGIDLGMLVDEVVEVLIDGVVVDPAEYTLIGTTLVKLSGDPWPLAQDMSKPSGEGTFLVRVRPGKALGPVGERALGALAFEYANALCGKKCSLPSNVTEVVRAGVTMRLETDMFAAGATGLRVVDLFIQSVNPGRVKQMSGIASPDVRRVRTY